LVIRVRLDGGLRVSPLVDGSILARAARISSTASLDPGRRGDRWPVQHSPDGLSVVLVASAPDQTPRLWIRRLDSLAAEPLPGTDGAAYPFWSPDGRFVAFFSQQKLKKIPAEGGPVQTLADAVLPRGGTWNRAGAIVFSASAGEQLWRVSSTGGHATRVALDHPNRESHWPDFLPDGRHFVFFGRRQQPGIYLGSID
jgi:Tol biopolymer transport system component